LERRSSSGRNLSFLDEVQAEVSASELRIVGRHHRYVNNFCATKIQRAFR
jgi:hypothetical protein